MQQPPPPPTNPSYGYGPPPPAYAPPPGQPYQGAQQPPMQPGSPPSAYGYPGAYGQPMQQKHPGVGMPMAQPGYGQPPPQKQKSSGLFGSLRKEWDSAVNTFDKYTHSGVAVAEFLNINNVVQLISRNSGRAVQIVQAPNGVLTLDANGYEGPNVFNALWTVAMSINYTVQLHNNFNYLAIENGNVCLKHYPMGTVAGPETKLRAVSVEGQFVYLECDYDQKFHVGFEKNGLMKSAIATGRDVSAQFAIRLISGVAKR